MLSAAAEVFKASTIMKIIGENMDSELIPNIHIQGYPINQSIQ